MSLITVNLRIVGIFFSEKVEVDASHPLSVKNVLDAYISTHPLSLPRGLSYSCSMSAPGPLFLDSFSHNYDGSYEENGNSVPDGATIGNKVRPAGIYKLAEIDANPIAVVWQYYVIDATTHKNKTKTLPGEGFTPFTTPLTGPATITQNDTIIWRMVAIVRSPNA